MTSLFHSNLDDHIALFKRLSTLDPVIEQASQMAANSLKTGGKLMLCGNGGSAADCQHISAEFTGRFIRDRRPLAAIALTTDTSALTCISNDYNFDSVFLRQVEALGRAGDCLIAISTSGNSSNVIQAIDAARQLNIVTVGLLGRDGGALRSLCDVAIVVESSATARIQEAHILIGHTLCGRVEQLMGIA